MIERSLACKDEVRISNPCVQPHEQSDLISAGHQFCAVDRREPVRGTARCACARCPLIEAEDVSQVTKGRVKNDHLVWGGSLLRSEDDSSTIITCQR